MARNTPRKAFRTTGRGHDSRPPDPQLEKNCKRTKVKTQAAAYSRATQMLLKPKRWS